MPQDSSPDPTIPPDETLDQTLRRIRADQDALKVALGADQTARRCAHLIGWLVLLVVVAGLTFVTFPYIGFGISIALSVFLLVWLAVSLIVV